MIYIAKKASSLKEGEMMAIESIKNGKALEVFRRLIKVQGGDDKVIDDYSRLPLAKIITSFKASKSGYISSIACKEMGLHCVALGGGRNKASDKVDLGVGFIFNKKVGDKVTKGESLVEIYHNKNQAAVVKDIISSMGKEIKIAQSKVASPKLIFEIKEI